MSPKFKNAQRAFTLLELLTVMAIIGILASLVLGLGGLATTKSRETRMRGEHGKIVTAIEAYKAEMGNYPPDGMLGQDLGGGDANLAYHMRAGLNPLFYELSGATFANQNGGEFIAQNQVETEAVKASELKKVMGVNGIQNSARTKREIPFKGVSFKAAQYAEVGPPITSDDIELLVAPIKGPFDSKFPKRNALNTFLNPWFYDATSTNRHNQDGFDLWSEYIVGNRTNIIGNWKD